MLLGPLPLDSLDSQEQETLDRSPPTEVRWVADTPQSKFFVEHSGPRPKPTIHTSSGFSMFLPNTMA